MESSLNAILSEINSDIKAALPYGAQVTFYGECVQIVKEEKTVPILNVGSGEGKIIEWDDGEPLRVYHRILDVVEEDKDNFAGFGANSSTVLDFPMRMVVIGTRSGLAKAQINYEDNTEFVRDFSKAMTTFTSTKEIITKGEHQAVKPEVFAEEYPDVEQQHLNFVGVAFWINYEIRQRVCY